MDTDIFHHGDAEDTENNRDKSPDPKTEDLSTKGPQALGTKGHKEKATELMALLPFDLLTWAKPQKVRFANRIIVRT